MSKTVRVAARNIGTGSPCYVIAEAGVNHNGQIPLAHKLIDAAADARVDAVKFQTFNPEDLVSQAAPKAVYQVENTGDAGNQFEMLQQLVLPKSSYQELMQHAAERNLMFLSTPFDEGSADFLEELGLPAFKISSGDLTNHPFLGHLARKGRPLLLSTGMATLQEVESALKVVESSGNPPLVLFHCVTNYPVEANDCNLRAMETLRSRFGVPVGWSDHTVGIDISLAAVALGAETVEKHFTLDRNLPGPDHVASLEPSELAEMVAAIRRIESALGDGVKRPKACEIAISPTARKSLHWKKGLNKGTAVAVEDMEALRPGTGLPPSNLETIVGRCLTRDVQRGEMVSEQDLVRPT